MNKLLFSTTVYDFVVLPAPHSKQRRNKRVNKYYECREALSAEFQSAWNRWRKKNKSKQITAPCKMKAIICRKSRRQADFDNLGKTVGDSLVDAGIIKDDSQIYNGEIVKRIGWHRNYVVISLYSYNARSRP